MKLASSMARFVSLVRRKPGGRTNLLECRRTAMKTNWPALRCGCLILSSVAVGAAPLLAQTQESAATAVISSVAITQASQRASVRVAGEGRLDAQVWRMQNPERLVLD